ncbi:MAG: T9SS type A sorting domain-containing protein [Saprospiraceae bacterium]|nr:T9SS type A sorting domain-containing protein [Saprospiraceae bacterium]
MNQLKFAVMAMAVMLLSLTANAQRKGGKKDIAMMEKFKSELQLTAEQEQQLEELSIAFEKEVAEWRNKDFDSREALIEAKKGMMQEYKAEWRNILTEEQNALLEQKMKERKKKGRKHFMSEEAKKEIGFYKEQNIEPVMKALRAKLEGELSAEDRASIAELRTAFQAQKEKMKALKQQKGERKMKKEAFMELKKGMKTQHEQLKALTEKYDQEISDLFAEIEEDAQKWKEDIHAIAKKYRDHMKGKEIEGERVRGRKGEPKHGRRGHGKKGHRGFGKNMKKGHFLLMDPTDSTAEAEALLTSADMEVYPNPTNSYTTLTYTVNVPGNYRVELRDERGNVLKVLADGPKETGEYTEEIDLSTVDGGLYYIAISNEASLISKKLIVTRG